MATIQETDVKALFDVGAHFGYQRGRRHPTAAPFIFTTKDRSDIFDLAQTAQRFTEAREFISKCATEGKTVLFVGGKAEVATLVKAAAEKVGMPYVASRWVGGTLTNFKQIRRRIDRMEKLTEERDRGERTKYTKRERLMLDREIEELEARFGGLRALTEVPAALFVVDARHESIAVAEANQLTIPVVALASSDCDFSMIQYPIPANDSTMQSVKFFVGAIADSYHNKKAAKAV